MTNELNALSAEAPTLKSMTATTLSTAKKKLSKSFTVVIV